MWQITGLLQYYTSSSLKGSNWPSYYTSSYVKRLAWFSWTVQKSAEKRQPTRNSQQNLCPPLLQRRRQTIGWILSREPCPTPPGSNTNPSSGGGRSSSCAKLVRHVTPFRKVKKLSHGWPVKITHTCQNNHTFKINPILIGAQHK